MSVIGGGGSRRRLEKAEGGGELRRRLEEVVVDVYKMGHVSGIERLGISCMIALFSFDHQTCIHYFSGWVGLGRAGLGLYKFLAPHLEALIDGFFLSFQSIASFDSHFHRLTINEEQCVRKSEVLTNYGETFEQLKLIQLVVRPPLNNSSLIRLHENTHAVASSGGRSFSHCSAGGKELARSLRAGGKEMARSLRVFTYGDCVMISQYARKSQSHGSLRVTRL
ncbi:hypothetical protein Sjap_003081 [Stephania japonica]|uniref:Uncharacterized protein n=1 Tax=Stephania japonica TaxID=461633 RepID=A0AAP0KN22_9MAGN